MARILDITPISDSAQMPVKKGTLQFLQDAHKISLNQALIAQVGDSFNGLSCYVLYGCKNTGSYPNYNISAGAVWCLGEVYEVDAASFAVTGGNVAVVSVVTTQYTTNADPVTFTDASSHNVHNIRKAVIGTGTSGSGISDYADVVFDAVRFPQATETVIGVSKVATQSDVNTGTNDTKFITPAKLAGTNLLNAWILKSDTSDVTYTVTGIGVTVDESNIKYKIIGKTMSIAFEFKVTQSINPCTAFYLLLPASKQLNIGFDVFFDIWATDAGSRVTMNGELKNSDPTKIKFYPATSLGGGGNQTVISGILTFEIA